MNTFTQTAWHFREFGLKFGLKFGLMLAFTSTGLAADVDFRSQIAPIISEHCVRCHYPGNRKGDISLASADDLQDNLYIVPGEPDDSYLVELIEAVDGDPPAMPQDADPLTPEQVALIRNWVADGAKWPADVIVRERSKADDTWWSLQPIAAATKDAKIDDFVLAELSKNGLSLNPPADRVTLIRRATYDLIGLPPTPDEVAAFAQDTDPAAYDKLIDRLLESPHYGERWGRHWLDVVRFGESIGYERNVIINNIWPFRDYVIRSINEDKPFDQLIREHLAGDVISPGDQNVAVGTAFLVAGPYDDVGNSDVAQAAQIRANTIDEIIRATTQAFLGLTVGCARCHDHKFDPILQSDYYSMYSIFAGIRHGSATLATMEETQAREAILKPLDEQRDRLQDSSAELKAEVLERGKSRLARYEAKWKRRAVDRRGTTETFEPVTAKFVRIVCEANDSNLLSRSGFGIDEFEIWSAAEKGISSRNVALASGGSTATGSSRHIEDFPDAYSPALAIDGKTGARFIAAGSDLTIELPQPIRIHRVVFFSARGAEKPEQGKFTFVAEYRIEVSQDGKSWQEVANGQDRKPTQLASNPSHLEFRLSQYEITDEEKAKLQAIAKKQREVQDSINQVPALPSVWIGQRSSEDAQGPFHVFIGGDPQQQGDPVRATSLSVLSQPRSQGAFRLVDTTSEAERRQALADWITHPSNPLTARVLANRIWHYHFGRGIVDTPSDFGYMGGRPTHPKLLDFLATQLKQNRWQIKAMHRLIMKSQAYQQASTYLEAASKLDHNARLLWRFPPRRLSAEEIRDTILMVAGKAERVRPDSDEMVPDGGPGFRLYHFMQDNVCTYVPLDEHGPETYRRAVYHQNARASVVDLMTDFDQPDCTFSTPKRAATTTPLQALTMLNHRFTLDMAHAMAERLVLDAGSASDAQIRLAYQLCYTRNPTADEVEACCELIDVHSLTAMCRALLNTSELIYVR